MPELCSSRATLLFAMGVGVYLTALHTSLALGRRRTNGWIALVSALTVVFALARYWQLYATDAATAVWAARAYVATTPLLIWTLCRFARSLSETRMRRSLEVAALATNLAIAALVLTTPWFVTDETSSSRDLFGRPFIGAKGGPGNVLLAAQIVLALAWVWRKIERSADLVPAERRLLQGSLAVYALMGASTFASSYDWIPLGVAEYGPLMIAIGFSHMAVGRQRRLEDRLRELVQDRSEALAESEAWSRELIECAPIGIVAIDANGQTLTVNRAMWEIVGVSDPDSVRGPLRNAVEEAAKQGGGPNPIQAALAAGKLFSRELRYRSRLRGELWLHLVATPRRDAKGNVTGAVLLIRDVTEQKAIEQRLRQAQKLQAVGQLAAGIVHEISNPMTYVRGNLGFLRERWSELRAAADLDSEKRAECDEFDDVLAETMEGAERVQQIVREMKQFAHTGQGDRERVSLTPLLQSSVRVASTQAAGGRSVVEEYGEEIELTASPGQLRQVFVNLVVNALQAVGEGGRVVVSSAREGDVACVRVQDDGPGIPAHVLERIFEPFFTTKPAGVGTGLGLFISYEIVRAHGGELRVVSSPGAGTTFEVRLPLGAPER